MIQKYMHSSFCVVIHLHLFINFILNFSYLLLAQILHIGWVILLLGYFNSILLGGFIWAWMLLNSCSPYVCIVLYFFIYFLIKPNTRAFALLQLGLATIMVSCPTPMLISLCWSWLELELYSPPLCWSWFELELYSPPSLCYSSGIRITQWLWLTATYIYMWCIVANQ